VTAASSWNPDSTASTAAVKSQCSPMLDMEMAAGETARAFDRRLKNSRITSDAGLGEL
jgi:hypothetical protein